MSSGRHAFLEVADRIGRQLCRDAVWAGGRCNWLGWAMEPRRQFHVPVYRAQGPALSDGTAGIALFLAELLRRTGDALVRHTLKGTLAQLSGAAETAAPHGFHHGRAGIAAAFVTAGHALGEERWAERGRSLLAVPEPADDAPAGVADGMAGTLLALLAAGGTETLDAARVDAARVDAARALGDRLRHAALTDPARRGYAGGASGTACALAELAHATGKTAYRRAAVAALRAERALPGPRMTDGKTSDGKTSDGKTNDVTTGDWTGGAPAVALSRLVLQELLPEESESVTAELEDALQQVQAALSRPVGPGQGFSLAHGAAGLAEVLLVAGRQLGRPALRAAAEAVGQTGIALFHQPDLPWPCGVPVRGETPNLMLGLAGIGHFYLRLHAPAHVPSVLVVSPASFGLAGRRPAAEAEITPRKRRTPPMRVTGGSHGESHGREADAIVGTGAVRIPDR